MQADWAAAAVKDSLTVARVQVAQAQVTERVVTQYVDRVRTVREVGDPRHWYRDLWNEINSPGSWDANPWVWVVEFKRVQP